MKKFSAYLIKTGKSKKTIYNYVISVRKYLNWIRQELKIDYNFDLSSHLSEYIAYNLKYKEYKRSTIAAQASAIMKYNEFLQFDIKTQATEKTRIHIERKHYNYLTNKFISL